MSKSIEGKAPRLHGASTLKDAAAWLTYWSQEAWDAPAVLGRFREWAPTRRGHKALSPESVKVVVPAGRVLLDKMTGEQKLLQRPITLMIGGHALDGFLVDLHEHGEAIPSGLVNECGPPIRWAIETPLTRAALRLSPSQVESLLPESLHPNFDRLLSDAARGEYPQLLPSAEQGPVGPWTTVDQSGRNKRWTDSLKAEVRAYREKAGLKATAEHFGVAQATISKHVPAGKERPKKLGGVWGGLEKK